MELIQGSKAWFDLHNKHLTGSRFGDVLADPSTKRYKGYMNEIIDSILGVPYFEDDKPWHAHGKAWEPEARAEYEWRTGNTVKQDFFIIHPTLDFVGVSPDGFVPPKINCEIKSHKGIPENLKTPEKVPSASKAQVQGQMWCCPERKLTHFIDFYKDEVTEETDMTILVVEPDFEYHKKLECACVDFWAKIQERLRG